MDLRLYKEPYHEPYSAGRLRLLFEGVIDASDDSLPRRDFYLYVWIDNGRSLWGFQAVLDEEYVVEYHAPAKLEFSRIGGRPVKRSLSRPLNARERKSFLGSLLGLSNAEFPDLVARVEAIVHGETAEAVLLTMEESATLQKLAEQSSGATK